MKVAAILFALIAVALAADKYTTKYDAINVDDITKNPRLLKVYIKCLLQRGKCNDQGQTLKEIVPDALITACSKCSETQKTAIEKVIRFLIKNHRSDWDSLVLKYDPNGTHRKNYQKYYDEVKP